MEGIALVAQGLAQLLQHNAGDTGKILLGQVVETDDLVHAVQELGAQEVPQCLHNALLPLVIGAAAEAHRTSGLGVGTGVAGHDDDRIFEVHLTAVGVGDLAVVQDLQQDIKHVGVCLLDLIEQHHGVRLAADLLRQLARLVIAHIARGRSHDAGDGVLLHKLGHIQADQGLRRVEQVVRQLLHQLRLTHAGGSHEDKAHRLVLG